MGRDPDTTVMPVDESAQPAIILFASSGAAAAVCRPKDCRTDVLPVMLSAAYVFYKRARCAASIGRSVIIIDRKRENVSRSSSFVKKSAGLMLDFT